MVVYIAGKYSAETLELIQANIDKAKAVAQELWGKGYAVICPHTNTAHFDETENCTWETYLSGDEKIILRCDAVIVLDNYEQSKGAKREIAFAEKNGIPVYYYPDIPSMSTVTKRCPNQVEGFVREIMNMYRIHQTKNEDYSPANILGTGEVGVVTRMWDKMARLMNLTGFKIEIKQAEYSQPQNAKHESIDDTLLDVANYAVILRLLRRGEWGR